MSKNVIITGANGALGTAVVKRFLDESYQVIAVDGAKNHLDFAAGNNNFDFRSMDLANESLASKEVAKCIEQYSSIQAALLLAGGFAMGKIHETDVSSIQKMITLNFETAYNIARPVFANMMKNGYGRIVLVGARPPLKPEAGKGMFAYALSKSLLFRMAELLNAEASGTNVVVTVIVPSTIDTAANRSSMPSADPGKWVKPEQLAEVLSFICSEKGNPLRETVLKIYNNA
jgi:NAD(P)-dependent dehydrogenase (short-subunit alcohol dehydrogenase family)